MALEVIGAGPGRTATLSLKFALEHLGFGPCYHMMDLLASARRNIPLWTAAGEGRPDWEAIFDGYRSATDNPACAYWRELAGYYPQAKIVLTVRDSQSWFESVNQTIHSEKMANRVDGSDFDRMMQVIYHRQFGDKMLDRDFMVDWYESYNREVIDTIAPERLLVYHPREGWDPLCNFLGVDIPDDPFPKVNSRDEISGASDGEKGMKTEPENLEQFAAKYLETMRAAAFPG